MVRPTAIVVVDANLGHNCELLLMQPKVSFPAAIQLQAVRSVHGRDTSMHTAFPFLGEVELIASPARTVLPSKESR